MDNKSSCRLKAKGISTVCGGLLLHISMGALFFTFGNVSPYFTSYLRYRTSETTLQHSDSMWVISCHEIAVHLTLVCSGVIELKLGARMTSLLGGLVNSLGLLLTYFTVQHSLVAVSLTYGIMFGAGAGIAYSASVRQAMEWYPENTAFVCGLVVAGIGVSAITFNEIEIMYTNPNNLGPNVTAGPNNDKYFGQDEILDRVPSLFIVVGVVCAVMTVIGVLLLFDPPKQDHTMGEKTFFQQLTNTDDEIEDALLPKDRAELHDDVHPLEMIKTKNFWLLWFIALVNGEVIMFLQSLYKAYGETFIPDDRFLALVGSISMVFASVGRILWGIIADRLPIRTTLVLQHVIITALLLTFTLSEKAGKWMFLTWLAGMMSTLSGTTANLLSATAIIFRMKYFATNYGLVCSSMIPGGIIGPILSQNVSDYIGWSGIFSLVAGFSFSGIIFSFLIDVKD
ncbi:oxalate:formate antiporter-like isoform X1 [Paramuricea clavata]|uniref:Oxalate:formate antiporter-like isoform X1 n=1 Tax=Paramuricea clavata TaxID=317549 RepID=A0A6S7HAB0_PARCT|nr:oxalate:formate antiporter-like isoform X1 [Paramuricea clavata]